MRKSGGATHAVAHAWITSSASAECASQSSGAQRYRIGEKWNVKWLPPSTVFEKPENAEAMVCVNSPRSAPE